MKAAHTFYRLRHRFSPKGKAFHDGLVPCICRSTILVSLLLIPAVQKLLHASEEESRTDKMAIDVENYVFTPMVVNIAAGTTVAWVNHDPVPHEAGSREAAFKSDLLAHDEKVSLLACDASEDDWQGHCALITGTLCHHSI
jgi:plastocyanin